MIRAIGLDASDTLFYNARRAARIDDLERAGHPGLRPALADAIQTVGARGGWPEDTIGQRHRHDQWRRFLRRALVETGFTATDAEAAAAGFADDIVDPASYVLFDDVLSTLDTLDARDIPTCVVSNFDPLLWEILDHLGIDDRFATVVTSWEVGRYKPDPLLFEVALVRLDLPAPALLFAGDSPRADVEGARAAGLPAVLLDRTNQHEGFAGPRIGRLTELLALLGPASCGG